MPKYYFHVLDGTSIADLDGTVLPGPDAARHEAVRLCAGLLNDGPGKVWEGEAWELHVHDDTEELLFTLTVQARDAVSAK